jgi:hypothetical protein
MIFWMPQLGCPQVPNSRVCQRLTHADSFLCDFCLFLKRQSRCEGVCFFGRKKSGFTRSAGQQEIRSDSGAYGRNALQNQQPTPTADPKPVNVIQNQH